MRLQRWGAPIALAVVVVVVLGGALWLFRGSGDGSGAAPPLLRLSSASGGARDAAMSAAGTAEPANSGAAYTLVGTLPDGTPADQPIYRLSNATADDMATLMQALDMSGDAKRVDGGWVVKDGEHQLTLRDDGGWSYGPDCDPGSPVSDKELTYGCAVAISSGTAVAVAPDEPNTAASDDGSTGTTPDCPPDSKDCAVVEPAPDPVPAPEVSPGPSEAEARAAADRVLAALGMSDARVTVWPGDPTASVQASPQVHGLDTVGLGTSLQIDGNGDVIWADGHLLGVDAGASYPVISAQAAFDKLLEQPQIMMDICRAREDGEPGCADIPPAEVTGGALGLLLDYDSDRPVLVPAWLFDVKDQPEPAAQIAIDPSFLAPPPVVDGGTDGGEPKSVPPGEPVPVDGGGGTGDSGSGSSTSGNQGTTEPAPPVESPAP